MSRSENFAFHLKYVSSSENVADAPSRAMSDRLFSIRCCVEPSSTVI